MSLRVMPRVFHIARKCSLVFYDIKIKVYVELRERRKAKKGGKEKHRKKGRKKHLGRRFVDSIINDYNIEMIDIYQQYKTCLFFRALFRRPFFLRLPPLRRPMEKVKRILASRKLLPWTACETNFSPFWLF